MRSISTSGLVLALFAGGFFVLSAGGCWEEFEDGDEWGEGRCGRKKPKCQRDETIRPFDPSDPSDPSGDPSDEGERGEGERLEDPSEPGGEPGASEEDPDGDQVDQIDEPETPDLDPDGAAGEVPEPCAVDAHCPAGSICAEGVCQALTCADFDTEGACLAREDCKPVYSGVDCVDASGGECTSGDTDCTCASFAFALCVDVD